MPVAAGRRRLENSQIIGDLLRGERPVLHVRPHRGHLGAETISWADYWRPGREFFSFDLKLVQRLNRLKAAWRRILAKPSDLRTQTTYCWRYFGLLHHTLRLARHDSRRGDCIPALRCIVGFESFLVELAGQRGAAAVIPTGRNPVYLVGRLAASGGLPTTRHVPLVLPRNENSPFYHYRQLTLSDERRTHVLVAPQIDLALRSRSFDAISRFQRLTNPQPDPYYDSRAELLAQRVVHPLAQIWENADPGWPDGNELALLDLGAGTGHLAGQLCSRLRSRLPSIPGMAIQLVDSTGPSFGRSFGITRPIASFASVEWATADYRELLDDDVWLHENGPFDIALLCRLLDNFSTFSIEPVAEAQARALLNVPCPLPNEALARRERRKGKAKLSLSTKRQPLAFGQAMPQFSLNDYFAAMRVIMSGDLDAAKPGEWYLPIRRFNPAALTTKAGRSILAQLMNVARAVVIEDVDLEPADLIAHKQKFGLSGTAGIHCTDDGFRTEAYHVVVTRPEWAARLRGKRLW